MARKLNALFTIGPKGIGATTFTELLNQLLMPKHYKGALGRMDMDDIIGWYARSHTALGREIRKFTDSGKVIPGELVASIFFDWLDNECGRNPFMETLLVSEFPDTDQNLLCATAFERAMVFVLKNENSPATLLNGRQSMVYYLNRSKPLAKRLKAVLEFLKDSDHSPIDRNIVKHGLNRLRADNHPINERIRRIEAMTPSTTHEFNPQPTDNGLSEAMAEMMAGSSLVRNIS